MREAPYELKKYRNSFQQEHGASHHLPPISKDCLSFKTSTENLANKFYKLHKLHLSKGKPARLARLAGFSHLAQHSEKSAIPSLPGAFPSSQMTQYPTQSAGLWERVGGTLFISNFITATCGVCLSHLQTAQAVKPPPNRCAHPVLEMSRVTPRPGTPLVFQFGL